MGAFFTLCVFVLFHTEMLVFVTLWVGVFYSVWVCVGGWVWVRFRLMCRWVCFTLYVCLFHTMCVGGWVCHTDVAWVWVCMPMYAFHTLCVCVSRGGGGGGHSMCA